MSINSFPADTHITEKTRFASAPSERRSQVIIHQEKINTSCGATSDISSVSELDLTVHHETTARNDNSRIPVSLVSSKRLTPKTRGR